jgi:hypothetical protein
LSFSFLPLAFGIQENFFKSLTEKKKQNYNKSKPICQPKTSKNRNSAFIFYPLAVVPVVFARLPGLGLAAGTAWYLTVTGSVQPNRKNTTLVVQIFGFIFIPDIRLSMY